MSGRYVSRVLESDLPAELKFTAVVLASFADEDGYRIWPSVGEVAYLRGVGERQVQVHLKELRRMEILEIAKPATQWFPAQYRMRLDKLATRAPYHPPDRQPYLLGPPGESPPVEKSGVQPTAPQPGVQSSVPGVQPTAPDPSLDPSRTHTYVRAREGDPESGVQPAAPLRGESPTPSALPLLVAPSRDPEHAAHAWCGRVCVPKFLHKQFKKALGGPVTKRAARLRAFYTETLDAIPTVRSIEPDPAKFWRPAFTARFGGAGMAHDDRLTRRELEDARTLLNRAYGRCPHDPRCATDHACIREIALARKIS